MNRPRVVVVDTHIVVAGLLTGNAASPTARILDGMLVARFVFLLSTEVLAEYRAVLLRPAIRDRHQLDEAEIDSLLTEIVRNGLVRKPARAAGVAPDRDDQHLWDLAATEPGSVLVTGDRLLLETGGRPPAVLGAVDLVAVLEL